MKFNLIDNIKDRESFKVTLKERGLKAVCDFLGIGPYFNEELNIVFSDSVFKETYYYAYFNDETEEICISARMTKWFQISCFLHEFSHWLQKKMGFMEGKKASDPRSIAYMTDPLELSAEAVSVVFYENASAIYYEAVNPDPFEHAQKIIDKGMNLEELKAELRKIDNSTEVIIVLRSEGYVK